MAKKLEGGPQWGWLSIINSCIECPYSHYSPKDDNWWCGIKRGKTGKEANLGEILLNNSIPKWCDLEDA